MGGLHFVAGNETAGEFQLWSVVGKAVAVATGGGGMVALRLPAIIVAPPGECDGDGEAQAVNRCSRL